MSMDNKTDNCSFCGRETKSDEEKLTKCNLCDSDTCNECRQLRSCDFCHSSSCTDCVSVIGCSRCHSAVCENCALCARCRKYFCPVCRPLETCSNPQCKRECLSCRFVMACNCDNCGSRKSYCEDCFRNQRVCPNIVEEMGTHVAIREQVHARQHQKEGAAVRKADPHMEFHSYMSFLISQREETSVCVVCRRFSDDINEESHAATGQKSNEKKKKVRCFRCLSRFCSKRCQQMSGQLAHTRPECTMIKEQRQKENALFIASTTKPEQS
eukprot:TRINITY_DN4404_c0_g1_i1.p1 TRINITY_DN4404_c0_g1~~TRINITY_DN4404_c0_g1_i1.p1  ORF type:complete len:269 (+),score=11.34 TRINITY_DN4404_c0_g1_i1:66-872(+)